MSEKWPTELIEELAALEHERWSGWEIYRDGAAGHTHHSGEVNTERWKRQCFTPYRDLSEAEKQSDRDEVKRTLAVLEQHGVTPVSKAENTRLRAALRPIAREALKDVAENQPPNETDVLVALWDTATEVLKHIWAAGLDPEALAEEDGT